jgi:uncharacterized protein YjiS (DUF1127 family)
MVPAEIKTDMVVNAQGIQPLSVIAENGEWPPGQWPVLQGMGWALTHARIHIRAWALTNVRMWIRRERERGGLATLSPRQLQDIGLTTGDVHREVTKVFWQA